MPHDVFISYSSHDRPVADAIAERLEAAGVRCWIAPRDILPGDTYGGAIIRAISEATIMLLVFSEHANTSPQILREVERAVAREVAVLPVRIDDVKPAGELEYFISTHHWLDALPPPPAQHLDRITSVVQRVLAARRERGGDALAAFDDGGGGAATEPRRETSGELERPPASGYGSGPSPDSPTPHPAFTSPARPATAPTGWTMTTTRYAPRLLIALVGVLVVGAAVLWLRTRGPAEDPSMQTADTVAVTPAPDLYTYDEVDVKPQLLNPRQVAELADRHLPPVLRYSRALETVELSVEVRADGSVDPASMAVYSKVDTEISDAAREIGRQLRFSPGEMKGTPVAVSGVPVPITFNGASSSP